jgi:hypothetical protein
MSQVLLYSGAPVIQKGQTPDSLPAADEVIVRSETAGSMGL